MRYLNRMMGASIEGPPTFHAFQWPPPSMTVLISTGQNLIRIPDSTGILQKFTDLPGEEILQFISADTIAEKG